MSAPVATPRPIPGDAAASLVQLDLCGFASRMLEQCGGLVEWTVPGEAGTAVLPPPVARLLGVGEDAPLASRQDPGALCISLASEFLDLSEQVLATLVPRTAAFQIPDRYLKGGDLQPLVERLFTWHNARVRYRGSAPARVAYHSWTFFASLRSEEVFESRLNVALNAASLAPLDLPDLLDLQDLEPCLEPRPSSHPDTFDAAVRLAQERLLKDAAGFIARTESRLARDRKRLRDYYGALKREAGSAATRRRSASPPTNEQIEDRKRVVNLELLRKLAELDERHEMEALLEPIALVRLEATVLAVELSVQRKRAERVYHVYWNPLIKHFEPMGCSVCGHGTFSVAFTDDDVAALCARCLAAAGT